MEEQQPIPKRYFVFRVVKFAGNGIRWNYNGGLSYFTDNLGPDVWWNDYVTEWEVIEPNSFEVYAETLVKAERELHLDTGFLCVAIIQVEMGGRIERGRSWDMLLPEKADVGDVDNSTLWSMKEIAQGKGYKARPALPAPYTGFPEWGDLFNPATVERAPSREWIELDCVRNRVDGTRTKTRYQNCVNSLDYYVENGCLVLHSNSYLARMRWRRFHRIMNDAFPHLSGAHFVDGVLTPGAALVPNLSLNGITRASARFRRYAGDKALRFWRRGLVDELRKCIYEFQINDIRNKTWPKEAPDKNTWIFGTFSGWRWLRRDTYIGAPSQSPMLTAEGNLSKTRYKEFDAKRSKLFSDFLLEPYASGFQQIIKQTDYYIGAYNGCFVYVKGTGFLDLNKPIEKYRCGSAPFNTMYYNGRFIEKSEMDRFWSQARTISHTIDKMMFMRLFEIDLLLTTLFDDADKPVGKRYKGDFFFANQTGKSVEQSLKNPVVFRNGYPETMPGRDWGTNYFSEDCYRKMCAPIMGEPEIHPETERPDLRMGGLFFQMDTYINHLTEFDTIDADATWEAFKEANPAPVVPPPPPPPARRKWAFDHTIHPLDPEDEDAEAVAFLEQVEENERKVCHAILKIAIVAAKRAGRFPTGNAGKALEISMHGLVDLAVNQVNPNDDPGEYIIGNAARAVPEPWRTMVKEALAVVGIDLDKVTTTNPGGGTP